MGFPATLRPSLPSNSSLLYCKWHPWLNRKLQRLPFSGMPNGKSYPLYHVKSVLNNRTQRINGNGKTEPARILLERLFLQTQKLEGHLSRDSHLLQDFQVDLNLEVLESDLHAALFALKEKEEDLEEAERRLLLEQSELNRAKEELGQRETLINATCFRQERLEEELKHANLKLASQARQIEELKLRLRESEQEIATAQSALSLKEDEIEKMKNELMKQSENTSRIESELKCKAQLLAEANEVIKKQELELRELGKALRQKEEELKISMASRTDEENKLKATEATLEKQAREWLLAQEELKKLADGAYKHAMESEETLEDFRRVKKLLIDVQAELISSKKSLVSSRQKMLQQEKLLEKQIADLEEQRASIASYMAGLKDVQIEIESEGVKLRVAEARNKELEWDLSLERELMEELHGQLQKEKASLQQAIQDKSLLQAELNKRNFEFGETQDLLRVKESELVEAKLEIQHLKSQQTALRLILEDKDVELLNAKNQLNELNQELEELKKLMIGREGQLVQATSLLKEKEEHVLNMQHELTDMKLRCTEAESVVEQIVELTNGLGLPIHDDHCNIQYPYQSAYQMSQELIVTPTSDFRWKSTQLETEIDLTRESLRKKELELLASQRALALKDEELKIVLSRLDEKEKELKSLKEGMSSDTSDLQKLYELAQQRIGERSMGDLAIEKLQLEAAQLEVEAATCALEKLVKMTEELLGKTSLSMDMDADANIFHQEGSDVMKSLADFTKVKMEVAKLSALSEQLVKEAGIAVCTD